MTPTPAQSIVPPTPFVLDPGHPDPIVQYWELPIWQLATLSKPPLIAEQKERYRIFSLLLMKIVADNWNGNKDGQGGTYPWRPEQRRENGTYRGDRNGDRYLGHNIAAIAVDANGEVLDFDFNHNNIFDSSMEHAESRLVRRLFSQTQLYALKDARSQPRTTGDSYYSTLSGVTIYTSLESCAQCAGIMALGQVPVLVGLQIDPLQARITVILHNLLQGNIASPVPTMGAHFDFPYFDRLNQAYEDFCVKIQDTSLNMPFHIAPNGTVDAAPTITSFLCTDIALAIYRDAAAEFGSLKLQFPEYVPQAGAKTNEAAYRGALEFASYVDRLGLRGTPHL